MGRGGLAALISDKLDYSARKCHENSTGDDRTCFRRREEKPRKRSLAFEKKALEIALLRFCP